MKRFDGDNGVRRRIPTQPLHENDADAPFGTSGLTGFHQPGQPIGFLAARGTPYAKKLVSKTFLFITLVVLPVTFLISLVIILLPVLYAIANHTLNVSVMHIYSSNITDPHNDYFPLSLEGQVKKAGVFPAHLYFRKPTQVLWMTPPEDGEMREVQLGHFLSLIHI